MFENRREAGKLLAQKLSKYQNAKGVILAVPRGGVPVAYEVAKELNLPLEVILVKKLGHPFNKEYAIGAVGLNDVYVVPHDNVTPFYITSETEAVRTRLREMKRRFLGNREPEDLSGKTVIVIDDGIATGATLLATLAILKKSQPAKIVVATPVISSSAMEKLSAEADEVITLHLPETFYGVGAFYTDFKQVTDEEVIFYLDKLRELKKAG